jgi:hypothetical protein
VYSILSVIKFIYGNYYVSFLLVPVDGVGVVRGVVGNERK